MNKEQMSGKDHALPKMYLRYAGMIATASVPMYAFTYLNTFAWNHLFFSEERVYMTLTMTAMMAVVMLSFMLPMLKNRRVNLFIYAGSAVLFVIALWLVRSQATIQDVSYMKAMIPHHSIAILTSTRAQISDPRVRELADEIIASQRREISEMKVLVEDIEAHGEKKPEERAVDAMRLGPKVPPPDTAMADVPAGFRSEVVMSNLTYPTSVEFDDAGNMYVAEAGYSYGDESVKARIIKVAKDGKANVIAQEPNLSGPINDLLRFNGQMYVSHRGKISILESDGQVRDLVAGLPSDGDHHNNQLTVGPDDKIYFGQGTATNSGVVGLDNFKMGWLKKHPNFHDIPAKNIKLVGKAYESANPLKTTNELVSTLPYHAFGQTDTQNLTVAGQVKASGTILRMNKDGSGLEVYAWGFRNPFGLMWSYDKKLYATENGFDDRGSRPIANDEDDIYVVKEGSWYGWPDYAMGMPITNPRFKPKDKPQPQFLMSGHPPVEKPWIGFPKHSAVTKVDFSNSESFGKGMMYVAFFGHMAPMTGEAPDEHGGHQVIRIDPATRKTEAFFGKKRDHEQGSHAKSNGGQGSDSSKLGESFSAGPRRLLDVRFAPDGNALYIADFGAMAIQAGAVPVPGTGVIWRVVPKDAKVSGPPTNLSAPK